MQSATQRTDRATALAKEFLELRTSSPQQVGMFEAVWQGFLLCYGDVGVGVGVTWTSNEPMSMRPFTTRW